MQLTIEAFGPFNDEPSNAELVTQNKFGVHELIDGLFVTKELNESDLSNYVIITDVDFQSPEVSELNSQFLKYPFVKLA